METHYFFILLNYHDINLPSNIYVINPRSVMNPAMARETISQWLAVNAETHNHPNC